MHFSKIAQVWSDPGDDQAARIGDIAVIVQRIISVALGLLAIALFVMLLVGGFRYLTSGGDAKKTQAARNTLTYAIGGAVLFASAYLILRLIAEFTGADILDFRITNP